MNIHLTNSSSSVPVTASTPSNTDRSNSYVTYTIKVLKDAGPFTIKFHPDSSGFEFSPSSRAFHRDDLSSSTTLRTSNFAHASLLITASESTQSNASLVTPASSSSSSQTGSGLEDARQITTPTSTSSSKSPLPMEVETLPPSDRGLNEVPATALEMHPHALLHPPSSASSSGAYPHLSPSQSNYLLTPQPLTALLRAPSFSSSSSSSFPPSEALPMPVEADFVSSSSSSSSLYPPSRKRPRPPSSTTTLPPGQDPSVVSQLGNRSLSTLSQSGTDAATQIDPEHGQLLLELRGSAKESAELSHQANLPEPPKKRRCSAHPYPTEILAHIDPSLTKNGRLQTLISESTAQKTRDRPASRFRRQGKTGLPNGFHLMKIQEPTNQPEKTREREIVFLEEGQPPIPEHCLISFCLGKLSLAPKRTLDEVPNWTLSSVDDQNDDDEILVLKYDLTKDPFTTQVGLATSGKGNLRFEFIKTRVKDFNTIQVAYFTTKQINPGDPLVLEMQGEEWNGVQFTDVATYQKNKNVALNNLDVDETDSKDNGIADINPLALFTPMPLHSLNAPFFPRDDDTTFPLVHRTQGTRKKTWKDTRSARAHTLLGLFEDACTLLQTNKQSVSQEELIGIFYNKCLGWLQSFAEKPNAKYIKNLRKDFQKIVDVVRSGNGNVETCLADRKPTEKHVNRFQEIQDHFKNLGLEPSKIKKLLDDLYVRNPKWPAFVSGVFKLLKGKLSSRVEFEKISSLIMRSRRFSLLRQREIDFYDIPGHESFTTLFTFDTFQDWQNKH